MSLLATVTIFDCDDCLESIGLKNDEDWARFETEWYPGLLCQFCPKCRSKSTNQAAIRADILAEQRFDQIHKNLVRTYAETYHGKIAVV